MDARIMAEFHNSVAPGTGAEDVADIRHGEAEGVFLLVGGEVVAQAAAGPSRAGVEEGLEDCDGFLQGFVEGVNWGAVFAGCGRDGGHVAGYEVGEDFDDLLGVCGCYFAGGADGLFDGRVLAVAVLGTYG